MRQDENLDFSETHETMRQNNLNPLLGKEETDETPLRQCQINLRQNSLNPLSSKRETDETPLRQNQRDNIINFWFLPENLNSFKNSVDVAEFVLKKPRNKITPQVDDFFFQ